MSWESRNGKGRYYTRSRREGGRIVREYLGTGEVALLIAQFDELDREERERERMALRWEQTKIERAEAPIKALQQEIDLLTRGALLVAGYHSHRGEWRRKRE